MGDDVFVPDPAVTATEFTGDLSGLFESETGQAANETLAAYVAL